MNYGLYQGIYQEIYRYVSLTDDKPQALTTIDYFPAINSPITDYKIGQEPCLNESFQVNKIL